MYEVFLEARADRELAQLPPDAFRRIVAHVRGLADDPRPPGCRKLVGSKGDWRIRVGEYRVVYEIDDKARAIHVMRVRHRRQAY